MRKYSKHVIKRDVRCLLASSCVLLASLSFGAPPDGASLAEAARIGDLETLHALIAEGAEVSAPGRYDTPALHWPARTGDLDMARLLLNAGANPDQTNGLGVAPLHVAIEFGQVAMAQVLLDAGANPMLADRTGERPLALAVRAGSQKIVEALLAKDVEVDIRDPAYGQTALMLAARSGHLSIARLLIKHGASVDAQSKAGEVPAWRRPSDNAGSKGVGIIRGGWPARGERYPVPGAKTPLLYATRSGDLAMTRLLVESGASLELADANTVTPLLNAVINSSIAAVRGPTGHLEVAHYLIDQGADIHIVDWYGQTPLWAAVNVRNQDLPGAQPGEHNDIDREAVLKLIKRLLLAGADPNARIREHPPERRFITRLGDLSWADFTGQTPFLRAAFAGDLTVMRLLLEHGADPNISTYSGTTPLMAAAGINWTVSQTFDLGEEALLEAVRLCHQLGNDINAANSMGLTAIHGAANRGSDAIIRYLAAQDADLNRPDAEGRTPLDWAEGVFLATHPPVRKPETIRLLESLLVESPSEGQDSR